MAPNQLRVQMAIRDFQAARQRASVQEILARFSGKSTQLLSYDEVAEKLKLRIRTERGVQHIPIDAIVGSVGRDTDFTRAFLPRSMVDKQRWANVKAAMEDGAGLPPIEVYKVGEVYFVMDGNHRVSIAKQEGFTSIEARVIEVRTNVPLTPDVQPDDLIIKAEYAEFLEDTRIMDLRPNVDLSVSIPGQYEKLMSQIYLQKFIMVEDQKLNASLQDAVEAWYDNIYIPLAEAIRDRGLLRWFPNRTITDLYIWIAENRTTLEKEQGWEIQSDIAATDLILERSVKSEPGSWRKARTATRYTDHLFMDILVPLSGDAESWDSLEQAILIAQREEARIHGLHVVDSNEKVESAGTLAVQTQFNQICADAGVNGKLIIEAGEITKKISERATMTDLIVLKIVHPPMGGISSLRSPFRTILVNSSRPILGVPERATHFKKALLAYDGSERAKEALFVATYLAEMWKTELIVFTALDGTRIKPEVQDYVKRYLEIHEVEAEYILSEVDSKAHLKRTIDERQADLVLMGTYGRSVIREVVAGGTLDYILRESNVPTFICR
ncbi:MAG TPA: universal stress protein [Anaerolineales bacterium]|nr:universal stress protein [Anaerolineales bacterium]